MHSPPFIAAYNMLQRVQGMYNTQLFALTQFRREFPRFGPAIQNRFLTDVFADNPQAEHIKIRLRDAPAKLAEGEAFTAQTYFVFCIAAVEDFFRSSSIALTAFGKTSASPAASEETIERLCGYLAQTPLQMVGPEVANTLAYLRRRRNCYVHNRGIPNSALSGLIAGVGPGMQTYWAARLPRTPIHLDFTSQDLSMRSTLDLIGVLWIIRKILEDIDARIMAVFRDDLVLSEAQNVRIRMATRWRRYTIAEAKRKTASQVAFNLGAEPHELGVVAAIIP